MFSTWDLVRPRFWYPMSSLEQSMMELEHMSDVMSRPRFPFDMGNEMLAAPSIVDDDDFFRDLPMMARDESQASQHREATDAEDPTSTARDNDPNKQTAKANLNNISAKAAHKKKKLSPASKQADSIQTKTPLVHTGDDVGETNQQRRAFSSYSFSNSSILDDKGRRVTSTRRRYEDSTGRLKAMHEREVDGKKLRSTWNRLGADDKGQHEAVCSSGTPDEFEALWQQTPFGEAQKKTIKDQEKNRQQPQLEPGQQELKQHKTSSKSKAESEATPMEE